MIDQSAMEQLGARLQKSASSFAYPSTPDLAGRFAPSHRLYRPSLAWALALALVAFVSLLAVPEVRARLAEFLQLGGVRIQLPQDFNLTPAYTEPSPGFYGIRLPLSTLKGEVTLEEARAIAPYPITVPTYPENLRAPDHVYLQRVDPSGQRSFVILTWTNEENEVELALYVLEKDVYLEKGEPQQVFLLQVNDHPAAVVQGSHFLWTGGQDHGVLVEAPALIWDTGSVTYRIEANASVEELIQIAESIPEQE
jgi:hypothetical protein